MPPAGQQSRKKRIKRRLPKTILPIACADKTFHERWKPHRDPLNLPHPFRALFIGPPNCGKSCTLKNILIRAKPVFAKVIVVHCDPENTKEYDDLDDCELIGEIPEPTEFDGSLKTCLILDDIDLSGMSKQQKACLDRVFGYVSTHSNVSVCLTSQEAFRIPPIVRRCANYYCLWKICDIDSLNQIGRKCGFKKEDFQHIFDKYLIEPKDSFHIDLTDHSPYKLRINGYTMLERKNS